MIKFLGRTIIFVAIPVFASIILFLAYSAIVNSVTKEYKLDANITEVVIGDSHIQSSVNDSLLENTKNLGQSSESFYFSYFKLKEILENNPNVNKVYLGFSYHSLSDYYDMFISGEYSLSVSPHYFYILPVSEQIRLVKWNRENLSSYVKNIIKSGKRNILNEKDKNLFSGYSNDFINSTAVDSSMQKRLKFQYYTDEKLKDFSEINLLYLGKIVELCKMKNVDLKIINTPLHSDFRSKIPFAYISMYNGIISQSDLKVIDFSTMTMDDSCYTPDGDHVSVKGAVMMTKELKGIRNDKTN